MKATTAAPTFFATPKAFRAWFERHHLSAGELLVGFFKKGSGRPSITWPESVDQALCFGWIDGIRRRLDDERYTIRFTPRRPTGIWSTVNMKRVSELEALGLMKPAGRAAFERRSEEKSRIYSYEQRHTATLEAAHVKRFKANKKAWAFFQTLPPGYRRLLIYRVAMARKAETRLKRLDQTIAACAKGKRL